MKMINEDIFWDWFKKSNLRYLKLEELKSENEKEKLMDDLLEQLHNYCDKLYFLISTNDSENELIITAEGNAKYFGEVEKLVNKAPVLANWKIMAFKPPAEGDFVINYEGAELDSSKSWFIPLENDKKRGLGLRIYLENFEQENERKFLNAAYQALDTILGEKTNTLEVHHVEVEKLSRNSKKEDLISLSKLPEYIKWRKSKMQLN